MAKYKGSRAKRPAKGGCKSVSGFTRSMGIRKHVRSAPKQSKACLIRTKSGAIKRDPKTGLAMHKKSCTLENGKLVKVKSANFCSSRKKAKKSKKATTSSTAAPFVCQSKSTAAFTKKTAAGKCRAGSKKVMLDKPKKAKVAKKTGGSRPMPKNSRCMRGGKFVAKTKSGACPKNSRTINVGKGARNRKR